MEIFENQTLEMKNVLSFRRKMTQNELMTKQQEIKTVMDASGAKPAGSVVTTTYSVSQNAGVPVFDMEMLIPLDKEIGNIPASFQWKPRFLLTNALMIRHIGNPSALQNSINELNAYITGHHLTPITTGYNVTVKAAATPSEIDSMEINIYVGISPNIL